jgi:hypothetical protein
MNKIKLLLRSVLCALVTFTANAYAPTNFDRPYEVDFRLYDWENSKFRLGAEVEYGDSKRGFNSNEKKCNVLQIYNPQESSVGMLLGAPKGSTTEALARSLGIGSGNGTNDGYRGQFNVKGKYEETDCTFFSRYKLPINLDGTFYVSLFVPCKKIEYKDVTWIDQTKDILQEDRDFKEVVSSKLEQQAHDLGDLDINTDGWKKSGLGDIALMLGWRKDYQQEKKEYLNSVQINAQIGVTIPTGAKKDVDQSLSMPLGNNGAWGIPAILGLDLNFIKHIQAGVELSFLGLFTKSGMYRMKTSRLQTDYLLLNKGEASLDQGVTWKFTLFTKADKIFDHLSAMVSYHFVKHDDDRLSPKSEQFDASIVNSAESLKEWTTHSFVFELAYDICRSKSKIKPQISAFFKQPVTGKRAIVSQTIGGQIGCSF